jgi:N-acetylglucosamine kinase-like BadF-type ATPase
VDWCLIEGKEVVKQVITCGMNAVMLTEAEMAQIIREQLLPEVSEYSVDNVYFYGAGCISPEVCQNVTRAISASFQQAEIEVYTDLLAAARALCGREEGIACVMGTGSNSCYYDGKEIVSNVSPLGYILGDEGSGAVLGKLLIGDVLKRQLPEDLCEEFMAEYHLDSIGIIKRVYNEPQPNRFLASVSPFLIKHIEEPAIHRLVLNSFKSFFVRNICHYKGYKELKVSFVGSIAYYYSEVLKEAASAVDCTIATIIKSPMPGLIAYHSK